MATRFAHLKTPPRGFQSPGRLPVGPPVPYERMHNRGGRGGDDPLIVTTIKFRQGPFKGYRGRVVDVKGSSVRVELESQMKVVTVMRLDMVLVASPLCIRCTLLYIPT